MRLGTFIEEELPNVEKIEILPYHRMGIYKMEELGLEYKLKDIPDGTPEDVERARHIIEAARRQVREQRTVSPTVNG